MDPDESSRWLRSSLFELSHMINLGKKYLNHKNSFITTALKAVTGANARVSVVICAESGRAEAASTIAALELVKAMTNVAQKVPFNFYFCTFSFSFFFSCNSFHTFPSLFPLPREFLVWEIESREGGMLKSVDYLKYRYIYPLIDSLG